MFKEMFYATLWSLLMMLLIYNVIKTPKFQDQLPKGIVVEEYHDFFTGNVLFILNEDGKVVSEKIYSIVDLNVGDTIK